MRNLELYERVALARDFEDRGLKRGDVATIVDKVPHPAGGPDGFVLEVSNALGESLDVVVVTEEDIEPLHAHEVFAVRTLVKST
jgi:hypothetical protein